MIHVSDLLTSAVHSVGEDDKILRALESMLEASIHHNPVLDGEGRVVGILSDRDLLRALAGDMRRVDPVGDVMSRQVVTVRPSTPAQEAAQLMLERGISALPVVDDAGKLCGIVTSRDFLRVAKNALAGEPLTNK
ncbi:hypothetical protein BH11MYX4_BH11MYX4_42580 [soil metagenome]